MRSIAHISDLHFGRIDPPVADALAEDLRREPPSLLVISGDFTQRARAGQYALAAAYRKRLPMPQIVVPGNHDIPKFNLFRRFFSPLDGYIEHISADLTPVFQDQEMFVLGVNTARSFTHKSGWFEKEQLAGICDRFRLVPEGLMKVLVTHHPFIPSPHDRRGDILRGAGRALGLLEQCGVDLLLAGHLHRAYHGDVRSHHVSARRSVLSIQAGTATSTRRRHEPNSYNWITLGRDSVTVEVRTWNGRAFEASQASRYRRTDQNWRQDVTEQLLNG